MDFCLKCIWKNLVISKSGWNSPFPNSASNIAISSMAPLKNTVLLHVSKHSVDVPIAISESIITIGSALNIVE